MPIKIAINGFGRIGRLVFRRILVQHPNLEVSAINDLAPAETLRHLLKYDSLYGIFDKEISAKILNEKNPEKLPWKQLGILLVLECSGVFNDLEGASKHIKAGCKKVIISANSKTKEIPHFVMGVNQEKYNPEKDNIISMSSCTTNCLAPIVKVLDEEFGIEKGFMTTVHSYTSAQGVLDSSHKDIIPATTGAAKAIGRVLPELEGKIDGMALRVPTPTVSIVDFTAQVKKQTTREEVNHKLKKASNREELRGIMGVEDARLVSSDYKGNSFSSIVDANLTMVDGNLIKVLAWYDNEWAYACRLAEFANFIMTQ